MPEPDSFIVGVDLGGTNTQLALADAEANVLNQREFPTNSHEGPTAVLDRIAESIETLVGSNATIWAVGIGVPGQVDLANGTTKFLPNFPTHWRDIPVVAQLQTRLGCPVAMLNDARCATLGEMRFGHGKDRDITLALLTLGTGVGGGIAIDGRLRLGPIGSAGELGHQTILPNGPKCGCGNRGCLETLASGPAIAAHGIRLMRSGRAPQLHELVGGDIAKVTTREMKRAAEAGDTAVRDTIIDAANYIGIGVANIVTILHPDMVVLGGGVAEIGDLLIDHVRDIVRERIGMFPVNDLQIEKSLLGPNAGVMGAVALAQDTANRSTANSQSTNPQKDK